LFSVKEFAAGRGVARYFGSVAAATAASNTAVSAAAAKHVGSNVELQIFDIEKLRKEGSTRRTGNEPIDVGWHQFALWIKVPPKGLLLSLSFRRR
jgi:hypothetical protein